MPPLDLRTQRLLYHTETLTLKTDRIAVTAANL
jgi:hypothetical protein